MGLKITFENPSYPKGTEFGIHGVGIIKNGGSIVISDQQVETLLDERNAGVDEKNKIKQKDLFSGDSFKTEKVADPSDGEATTTHSVNAEEGGE